LPPEYRTATTPPTLLIERVSEVVCDGWTDFDGWEAVVVVAFFGAVVVGVGSGWPEPLPLLSDFPFDVPSSGGVVLVVVEVSGAAVLVVEGAAAADSARSPAVAPGRGSVLAGDAEAGFDAVPAEGLAGAASSGGDVGGTAVSGVEWAGRATSSAGPG